MPINVPRYFKRRGQIENRVLRRIFGPKREQETGSWKKLHNEKLHKTLLG
jgi:hypothetical protein